MIVQLLTLMILASARATANDSDHPVRKCDQLYQDFNNSLLNLHCILNATVREIYTKILTSQRQPTYLIELLREKNITWEYAVSSLTSHLKSLIEERRKREVINIDTCFDFMRQLDIMLDLLGAGSQTQMYSVSNLRVILIKINDIMEDIQCSSEEKEFLSFQMVRVEEEMILLSQLTDINPSTTTTTTTTSAPSITTTTTSTVTITTTRHSCDGSKTNIFYTII